MEPSIHDFLAKSLLNEQELVRDYQRFAMKVNDSEIAESFRHWAEEDGLRANKIEEYIHKIQGKKS
jgi:dimeric dUTPase (all-alpha-NTP-PPase superfamily)